jgi:mRNA deadenylase 3'-5' endonuclease subunit Ccr4
MAATLEDIFSYLERIEKKETGSEKLFFHSECDSNQTLFEQLNNKRHIAVSAKSLVVGHVLLTFLRQIIDEHEDDWYLSWLEEEEEEEEEDEEEDEEEEEEEEEDEDEEEDQVSVQKIVTQLHNHEKNGAVVHDLSVDGFVHKWSLYQCSGENTFEMVTHKRVVTGIDNWNIYRIGQILGIWPPSYPYVEEDEDEDEDEDDK